MNLRAKMGSVCKSLVPRLKPRLRAEARATMGSFCKFACSRRAGRPRPLVSGESALNPGDCKLVSFRKFLRGRSPTGRRRGRVNELDHQKEITAWQPWNRDVLMASRLQETGITRPRLSFWGSGGANRAKASPNS